MYLITVFSSAHDDDDDDDDDDEYLYLSRVALSVIMKYKITAINRGPIKCEVPRLTRALVS